MSFKNCNFQNEKLKGWCSCGWCWEKSQFPTRKVYKVWTGICNCSRSTEGHLLGIKLVNFANASRLTKFNQRKIQRNPANSGKFLSDYCTLQMFGSLRRNLSSACQRSKRFIDFELFNTSFEKFEKFRLAKFSKLVDLKALKPNDSYFSEANDSTIFQAERWLGKLKFGRKFLVILGFHFSTGWGQLMTLASCQLK